MLDLSQLPETRKRRAPCTHPTDEGCLPPSKKQKSGKPTHRRTEPGPAFWDRLSRVVLSRRALKEFDRRTQVQEGTAATTASYPPTLPRGRQLTQLKRFTRRGGPSLDHLRGYSRLATVMSVPSDQSRKRSLASAPSGSVSRQSNTTKESKTSPYSGDYRQTLIDRKVYPNNRASKPGNWDDIQQRLAQGRASLSPSHFGEAEFEEFVDASERAINESKAMAEVLPMMAGKKHKEHHSANDVLFNRIRPFDKSLTRAKPDLYDGVPPEKIDRRVRTELNDLIVPARRTDRPAAPNFFVEAKSINGRPEVAKLQACHDGAIGARAMHSLQNFGAEEPEYDGNAYSFSVTYHYDTLKLYATHLTAPAAADEPAEYHMTQIKAFALTSDCDTYRKGVTHYRNARDMAGEMRHNHIEKANNVAREMPAETPPKQALCSAQTLYF